MNGATEYFDWLVSKVYDITNQRQSYMNLLWYLFRRPFNWPNYIPMDENRAIEGILLRRRFEDEYGIDLYELDQQMRGYCSWLEMLVVARTACVSTWKHGWIQWVPTWKRG